MKKFMALFMMLLMLVSIVPLAFAEDESTVTSVDGEETDVGSVDEGSAETEEEILLSAEQEDEARKLTLEKCVEFIQGKFPRVSEEKAHAACLRIRNNAAGIADGHDDAHKGDVVRHGAGKIADKRGNGVDTPKRPIDDGGIEVPPRKIDDGGINVNDRRVVSPNHGVVTPDKVKKKFPKIGEARVEKFTDLKPVQLRRFAHANEEQLEEIAELDEEQIEKLSHLSRHRLKTLQEEGKLADAAKNIRVKEVSRDEFLRKRSLDENTIKDSAQRVKNLRATYAQTRDDLNTQRDEFKNAIDSGDEEAAVEHAKEYLLNIADLAISAIERVIAQIEGNDDLDDAQAAERIAELEDKLEELETAKTAVQNAVTKQEVKEAGKTIIDTWKNIKHRVRAHAVDLLRTRVHGMFKQAELLEIRLEKAISNLEEEGVDVADLDELLDQFSEHVDSARENLQKARELFDEAKDQDEPKDTIDEAKELVKQAHEELKLAHGVLKEVVALIKDLGQDLPTEDDVIQVVEGV